MRKLMMALVLSLAMLTTVIALPASAAPGGGKGGGGGGAGGGEPSGPDDSDLPGPRWPVDGVEGQVSSGNAVLRWNDELLQSIIADPAGTGPTVTSRALGVVHTAMYDAWTAYDATAVGVHSRPAKVAAAERTEGNKQEAVSHAAYQVLADLFPGRASDYAAQLAEYGYDVGDTSPAAQIGRAAADAVIAYRHADGSNQTAGYATPADNTYEPVNSWADVVDPWKWQPLCVPLPDPHDPYCTDGAVQEPLTPHWGDIDGFALESRDGKLYDGGYKLFYPPGVDDEQAAAETTQLLNQSADLSDTEKVTAEYWADGPHSVFPPGHWALFAQAVSIKKGHTLDQDVKLFFALGNAIMDAGIGAWKVKYDYDFVRPVTAIREQYAGQLVTSWLGPYEGYGQVPAEQWQPYQDPELVVSPPFPEYVSGHSTFSAAGHMVLAAFTGSDTFRAKVTIPAGSSLFEGADGAPSPSQAVPRKDVVLSWNTFTDAADEAGTSRLYGGIHFASGDRHGRTLGKAIGWSVWNRAQEYFTGQGELIKH